MHLLILLGISLDTHGRNTVSDWERERQREDGVTKQWLEETMQSEAYSKETAMKYVQTDCIYGQIFSGLLTLQV